MPGFDVWRLRGPEENRLWPWREEMDEREAEEKRDAEIRGFVEEDDRTERRRIVYSGLTRGGPRVFATVSMIDGHNRVQIDFGQILNPVMGRDEWERLVYAVESLLPGGER